MAVDLQVVFPQVAVNLSRIKVLPGSTNIPRVLDITGDDFSAVDSVYINEIESPDVVVPSANRLLAQVPEALARSTITSVTVLSKSLTLSARSILRFRIGDTPGKVSGTMRLLQLFIKVLFTTPGSDIFSPSTGGAGLQIVGKTFGKEEGGSIISSFVVSVSRTVRQIIAIQGRDPAIPPNERLLSARVESAGFNINETALYVSIALVSQAGIVSNARVVV